MNHFEEQLNLLDDLTAIISKFNATGSDNQKQEVSEALRSLICRITDIHAANLAGLPADILTEDDNDIVSQYKWERQLIQNILFKR